MKCSPLFFATLALALAVASGCKQDNDGGVVASVDGVKYLRKDLDKLVAASIAQNNIPEEQKAEARKFFEQRIINTFVIRTLLVNEAKKEGVVITPDDRQKQEERLDEYLMRANRTREQFFQESPLGEKVARQEFEEGILIEKLMQVKVVDPIVVDEAEVEKTLADIKARFQQAEEAQLAKRAKIEDIKKQLEAGADFAELAKANSDCPSGEKGGNLGPFVREGMVKPFSDAAFSQEIGKVGDIVETQFGYHLILVTAKTPAVAATGDTPASPETVTASHILAKFDDQQPRGPLPTADRIRDYLKQQEAQGKIQEYIESLRAKAKIIEPHTDDGDEDGSIHDDDA